jgi:hypothetical protein
MVSKRRRYLAELGPRRWEGGVKLNLDAKGKHLSEHQRWLAQSVADFFEVSSNT